MRIMRGEQYSNLFYSTFFLYFLSSINLNKGLLNVNFFLFLRLPQYISMIHWACNLSLFLQRQYLEINLSL